MPTGIDGRRPGVGIALVALLIAAALAAAPATAQQAQQPEWAEEAYENSTAMVETYNEKVDADALGAAGDQLKGETVNLYVEGPDGETATYAFEMQTDLQIDDLQRGTTDDATMKMTVDKSTYDRIIAADNPARTFRNAVQSGDIEIEGVGTVNSVKWGFFNGLADLARGLGLF